jgi:hypothetical protein
VSIDHDSYTKNDQVIIHGQAVPNTQIGLKIDSVADANMTVATVLGRYNTSLSAGNLDIGGHTIQAKSENTDILTGVESGLGKLISFTVSAFTEPKPDENKKSDVVGDINNDNKVDITDFSILAHWYRSSGAPKSVDLNGDGKITLADFSILAYQWNG